MLLLLGFSFLSGLVTILAPCIWPVLPIVLSSSVGGSGHKKPLGITLGIMFSFTLFTLSASLLVRVFHLDPNFLRLLAVIVIAFLGLMMIIPSLTIQFELLVSRLSSYFGQKTQGQGTGFTSGFISGFFLGIVWSPCAGPILATVAALAATSRVNIDVILVTLAYVIGVGIPLFAIAYGGQRFIKGSKGISKYTGQIQRIFGVIMILAALAIYTNYDQKLQLQLLNTFPALGSAVNGFENNSIVKNQLDILRGNKSTIIEDTDNLFNTNTPAPDFIGITKWLNTDNSISLQDLKGKVVLVDFWTYTCINCIRTLPHVTSWYEKYNKEGFVIIGVHTPEFEFEKDTDNVLNAIKMYNIHYPVAQDNNYATWNNYSNQYWPAEYLIDATGNVRRVHFGEGEYDKMEMAIQSLLKEAGKTITENIDEGLDPTPKIRISPETYLGAERMQYYYPTRSIKVGKQNLTLSDNPEINSFSLGGEWDIASEYATAGKNAVLNYNFSANKVFLVLRPGGAERNSKVKVLIDGKLVDLSNGGLDVKEGIVTIDSDRLYNLIDLRDKGGTHILKLEFQNPSIQVFAFTFG